MSFTFQNLADRARVPLNDSDKVRYPDSELLQYGVDAYLQLWRYRPDLFLASYSAVPSWSSLALGSTFPVGDDNLMPTIADYVTARAESKDDENILKERAQAFYALFRSGIGL
jgi:hypothetical protein